MSYKILSLNARGLNNLVRRRQVVSFLRIYSPDIVLIQESKISLKNNKISLSLSFKNYQVIESRTENSALGLVILISKNSNCLLTNIEIISDRILGISVCIDNYNFSIFNIHGPNDTINKTSYYNNLLQLIKSNNLPAIIMGDSNLNKNNNNILSKFTRHKNILELHFTAKYSQSSTFFTKKTHSLLDRAFLWKMSNSQFSLRPIPMHFSDHSAILLTRSSIKNNDHNFQSFYNFFPKYKILDYNLISNKISETLLKIKNHFNSLNPVIKWSLFKNEMKNFIFHEQTKELLAMKKEMSYLNKKLSFLCLKQQPDLDTINSVKAEISKLSHKKLYDQKFKYKNYVLLNNENPTSIFFNYSKLKKNKLTFIHLTHQGKHYTEKHEILKELQNFYSHKFQQRRSSSMNDINSIKYKPKTRKIFRKSSDPSTSLNDQISLNEITDQITSLKNHSSPGIDSLGGYFYKTFAFLFIQLLGDFFNYLISPNDITPYLEDLNQIYMLPILKKSSGSKGETDIENLRIISISNTDIKLFAKILNNRLNQVLPQIINNGIFSIKGRNLQHSILAHSIAINNYDKKSNTDPAIYKVDFSSAFDHLSVEITLTHLHDILGPSSTLNGIISLLTSRSARIKYNSLFSQKFNIFNGVLQGCPLSTTLYSIYRDKLIKKINFSIKGIKINKSNLHLKSLAFVDDLSICCGSKQDIWTTYNILLQFQTKSGSIINTNKTHLIYLKSSSNLHSSAKLKTKENFFSIYLFKHQKVEIHKQINRQLELSKKIADLNSTKELSLFAKAQIINALIYSRVSYYCIFYNYPNSWLNQMKSIVRKFLWKSTSHIALNKLTLPRKFGGIGLIDLELFITLRKARFLLQLNEITHIDNNLKQAYINKYAQIYSSFKKDSFFLNKLTGQTISTSIQLQYGTFRNQVCIQRKCSLIKKNTLHKERNIFLRSSQKTFIYLSSKKALPLAHNLLKKKIIKRSSAYCHLCKTYSIENENHFFHSCPFVKSLQPWLISIIPTYTLKMHENLFKRKWNKIPLHFIKFLITHFFVIWLLRCRQIFQEKSKNLELQYFSLFKKEVYRDFQNLTTFAFKKIWPHALLERWKLK